MLCKEHPNRIADKLCSACGDWFCSDCCIVVDGDQYCKSCALKLIKNETMEIKPIIAAEKQKADVIIKHTKKEDKDSGKKVGNGFWLFVLSCLPGTNYMYIGLIKRGLFMMTAFFLTCYLCIIGRSIPFYGSLFAFGIPIILFTSFFDGLSIRRRMKAGESVPDDIKDITSIIYKYRKFLAVFLLGFVVLCSFSSLRHFDLFIFNDDRSFGLLYCGIICYAIYRIVKLLRK